MLFLQLGAVALWVMFLWLVHGAVVNITYIAVGAYDAVVVSGSAVFNAAVG